MDSLSSEGLSIDGHQSEAVSTIDAVVIVVASTAPQQTQPLMEWRNLKDKVAAAQRIKEEALNK